MKVMFFFCRDDETYGDGILFNYVGVDLYFDLKSFGSKENVDFV